MIPKPSEVEHTAFYKEIIRKLQSYNDPGRQFHIYETPEGVVSIWPIPKGGEKYEEIVPALKAYLEQDSTLVVTNILQGVKVVRR